jgi:hypothetical protein
VEPSRTHLHVNPAIAALTGGEDIDSAVRCRGYLGDSGRAGFARLYFSLNDLSKYIEFREEAVLHVHEVPENVMAGGAVSIWLKSSIEVRAVRTRTMQARLLAKIIARRRRVRRWQRFILRRRASGILHRRSRRSV